MQLRTDFLKRVENGSLSLSFGEKIEEMTDQCFAQMFLDIDACKEERETLKAAGFIDSKMTGAEIRKIRKFVDSLYLALTNCGVATNDKIIKIVPHDDYAEVHLEGHTGEHYIMFVKEDKGKYYYSCSSDFSEDWFETTESTVEEWTRTLSDLLRCVSS